MCPLSKQKNKPGKSGKGLWGVKLHQFLSFSGFFDKNAFFGGEWAFFPGCAMSAHSPDLVMAVYAYLRGVYPNVGLSGNCCAQPSLPLGEGRFPKYLEILGGRFRDAGVGRVIVCCPNCAVTLRRIPNLEVVSIWQVLLEHTPEPAALNLELPVFVLHDPCPVRTEPKVYEAVREVLSRLGLAFAEYPANRDRTLCCGRAGMLMVREPKKGREMLLRRVSQSPCRDVVTYCFSCADAFKSAGCRALHGLEYIFASSEKSDLTLRESLARTWRNRWTTARRVSALKAGPHS
jgi:Fe-S oxidoreductase